MLFNLKRKSRMLYELLPFMYMGAGAVVIYLSQNTLGVFSGLLLIAAGFIVVWTRRSYRRAARQNSEIRAALTSEIRAAQAARGLEPLKWSSDLEYGHPRIDTLHRKLYNQCNALLEAIHNDRPKLDIELHIADLTKEIARHFLVEAAFLNRVGHPGLAAHQEEHKRLLASCNEIADRFHAGEAQEGETFKHLAYTIVASHVDQGKYQFTNRDIRGAMTGLPVTSS